MEIDTDGIMWILDGSRFNNITKCPPKLVLLDLNKSGLILHTYEFPEEVCLRKGGLLDDLVIEDDDGKYAYITDNSNTDPGLVVYSLKENRSWKLRDQTMFANIAASDFMIDGRNVAELGTIDGIALSPKNKKSQVRTIYYSNLIGYDLFSIKNTVLKNEEGLASGQWRRDVRTIGNKSAQSDGLMMDNKGNLYYTLLSTYGIGKWNIYSPFSTAEDIEHDRKDLVWPASFAMDMNGYLFVLANNIAKYYDPNYLPQMNDNIKFRILKKFTGTKSYLYE